MTTTLTAPRDTATATDWLPGAPSHIPAAMVQADRRIYAGATCSACKRRGMKTTAQHCGNRYRILGRCRWCNSLEVF